MKIDAVITWVDGDDPRHKAKRARFSTGNMLIAEDVAASTRFDSVGEIFWCVASLNRFAPWINKIYIVTDEQNPGLDDFMERNFPEGHIPMEIVDHKVIFRGYEQYLPTFNSAAIETMTWRIPGLSDHFIELNDDMVLCSDVRPDDFFTEDGSSVCYADNCNMPWVKFTRMIKSKSGGRSKVTFKGTMYNAAKIAGNKWSFMKINHTPRALRRDFYEKYFTLHPELMIRNIRHRFRDADMYTCQLLQYTLLDKEGKCVRKPVKGNLFYLQPKDREGYVEAKLSALNDGDYLFCCFNSIDKATSEELTRVRAWIEKLLHIQL